MTAGYWSGLAIAAGLVAPSAALAQPPVRLDMQTYVERVSVDVNGRERRLLATADRAEPGDRLIVVIEWRNRGTRPVHGFAVTRPVPRGALIDLSDPAMQASVDGGAHWGRLEQLWLPTPLGGIRRAVRADITHIRWLIRQLPPGKSGRLSYRASLR